MRRARGALMVGATLLATASAGACGARSSLEGFGGEGGTSTSVGSSASAASGGGGSAPQDAGPDVVLEDCPEAASRYIYAANEHALYRFDPTTSAFSKIGPIDLHGAPPQSIAVDRHGTAFISTLHGKLLRVDTQTAACELTSFVPPAGFRNFSLAFSTNDAGPAETLYAAQIQVYPNENDTVPSKGLAAIDTGSLGFQFIGSFSADVSSVVQLAGTGDGRLFAYSMLPQTGKFKTIGSRLAEIDKTTGVVLDDTIVPVGTPQDPSFGIAPWGGQFYLFADASTLFRYDPSTKALEPVASLHAPYVIGVLGASTCVPP